MSPAAIFLASHIALRDTSTVKTITSTATARRSLRKHPAEVRARIADKLQAYAENGAGDVKAMAGRDLARVRVGDYRVIFRRDVFR